MGNEEYKLSKLYIYITAAALVILSGYYYYRFHKYYDETFINEFNVLSLIIFLASIVLLILVFIRFNIRRKIVFLLLFITLTSSTILSYDFINPRVCADCEAHVMVGKRFQDQGLVSFLKNYNKPNLYKIMKTPHLLNKFLSYDSRLFFMNYKTQFADMENESPDIILSDNSDESLRMNMLMGNYSPLWFTVLGLWDSFSGDNYFAKIILPSNLVAGFFLLSLYFFLGLFYGKDQCRHKLLILFILMLLPIFFIQAVQNTTVLIVAAIVTWMFYFLLRNKNTQVNYTDALSGLLYSIVVLCKFTALTLMLPITLFYLIRYKWKAVSKLAVFSICFSVVPVLLYVIFGYDMILNVIIGSTAEFSLLAHKPISTKMVFWRFFHEPYVFGIPYMVLLAVHWHKITKYQTRNDVLISYMFVICLLGLFLLLWKEHISRHWFGFIVMTVPFLVYVYHNCEEKNKMMLSTSIFLVISNVLILIHEGIIMAGSYHNQLNARYWNW